MRIWFGVGLSLALGACATTPFDDVAMPMAKAYSPPTTGERARNRMSTDGAVRSASHTTCSRWDDSTSGVGPVAPGGGPLLTKTVTGKTLDMPGATPEGLTSTELYAPAGQPILFHYMKQRDTSLTQVAVCNGLFAFVPQAGRDYQAIFRQSADELRCQRGVIDIADRTRSVVRKDYDWLTLNREGRVRSVRNYVGTKDWVVALFPRFFEFQPGRLLGNKIGSAGFNGFDDGGGCSPSSETPSHVVSNVCFVAGAHGAFDTNARVQEIVDFLVSPQAAAAKLDQREALGKVLDSRLLVWAVWLLMVAAVVYLGIRVVSAAPSPAWVVFVLSREPIRCPSTSDLSHARAA